MDIRLALRRRDAAVSALRDLYSGAESFGFTSAEINTRFCAILNKLDGCPGWARDYLSGYRRALDDGLYERKLCHGGFYDGRFYSTHSNRSDYYERNGISACAYADNGAVKERGHYWIKHVDAGHPKPFFTMENEQC